MRSNHHAHKTDRNRVPNEVRDEPDDHLERERDERVDVDRKVFAEAASEGDEDDSTDREAGEEA